MLYTPFLPPSLSSSSSLPPSHPSPRLLENSPDSGAMNAAESSKTVSSALKTDSGSRISSTLAWPLILSLILKKCWVVALCCTETSWWPTLTIKYMKRLLILIR